MDGQANFATLLARVASELSALEDAGLRIEHTIGDHLERHQQSAPLALQELDHVVQRLRDMKLMAEALAAAAPPSALDVDRLVAHLKLGQSRAHMRGEDSADTSDSVIF